MHYAVLVLSHADSQDAALQKAADLLRPYAHQVETRIPYLRSCPCVGRDARHAAWQGSAHLGGHLGLEAMGEEWLILSESIRKATGGESGIIGSGGTDYQEAIAMIRDAKQRKRMNKSYRSLLKRWEKAKGKLLAAQYKLERQHPSFGSPERDCRQCGGTGLYQTQRNPNGRWGKWAVGGRMTGLLDTNYDPDIDPNNYILCPECEGYDEDACGICGGTGMARLAENSAFHGDIKPVADLPYLPDLAGKVGAIITPDGQWHGPLESRAPWAQEVSDLLRKATDAWAVLVECKA